MYFMITNIIQFLSRIYSGLNKETPEYIFLKEPFYCVNFEILLKNKKKTFGLRIT